MVPMLNRRKVCPVSAYQPEPFPFVSDALALRSQSPKPFARDARLSQPAFIDLAFDARPDNVLKLILLACACLENLRAIPCT